MSSRLTAVQTYFPITPAFCNFETLGLITIRQ